MIVPLLRSAVVVGDENKVKSALRIASREVPSSADDLIWGQVSSPTSLSSSSVAAAEEEEQGNGNRTQAKNN